MRAAAELFASKDFQGVLMDEVASAAGVGKGTLYRYFRTKDELFVQAVLWTTEQAVDHLRRHLEAASGTESELREVIWHTMAFVKENGSLFHILHHHKVEHSCAQHEEIHAEKNKLRGLIERIIVHGMERGDFREVDPHYCASMLWGMVHASTHWLGEKEPREIVDRLCELFVKGVKS